jgi:hypothetical protein
LRGVFPNLTAGMIPSGIRKFEMKLFLKPVHPNFYFSVGTLIGLPGACDPANRDRFRRRRGPYQGHYRQRHSELLALLCLVINHGGVTLLETRKLQEIGFSVLAIFSAGFLSDISRTLQLAL